jgi:hypothetical protein
LRKKRFLVPSIVTRNRGKPKQRGKEAIIFAVAALMAIALGRVTAGLAQTGYDRPGGDYTSAPVANGDPMVCAARCERDKSCRAWSFSYPSTSGASAMCWLKREVVPAKESSCCVSGVRGAGVSSARGTFSSSRNTIRISASGRSVNGGAAAAA